MNRVSRAAGTVLQTKANYGTAPVAAPTVGDNDKATEVRGSDRAGDVAEDCYVILKSTGAATLGAGGTVWLLRYSKEHSLWLKCAKLGGGNPIALSATLGHDEPIKAILSDSIGFDLLDEGGGALGFNVSLVMGRFLRN